MMKIIKISVYLMALMAIFTACEEPMDEITNVDYPRAFSPIGLTVTLATYDKATVNWKTVDNARLYVIELSQGDSLLFNNIIATYETESLNQALTGLWGETQYSVRVKSKSFNESQEDSKWYGVAFKTNAEQIFNTVADADIKTGQITVRWTPGAVVTKLTVSPTIGDVVLTAEEKAAGVKTLTGLAPVTKYTISIYNEQQRRGMVTATTKYRPSGEGVIEVPIGGDLGAITADAANIGKIIYLPEGFTYDVSAAAGILIAGKMTIYGDPDAVVKPTITLSSTSGGARVFQLPASADEVLFTNIALTGPGAGAGTSVLDQDLAKAAEAITDLKAVKFENCDMSGFGRSFIRLRSAAGSNPIGLVSLNNCVCKNFGNNGGDAGSYAFFTLNTVSSGIDDISVTNSTFQTQYHCFLNAPATAPNTSPAKKVNIENCTFNDIITGPTGATARYFIDGNNNTGLTITIKNVILGKAGTGDLATTKAAGYRIGAGSTIAVTGSYKTSDHSTAPATADFTTGITVYAKASTDLWTNPGGGDFTFKDAGFAGKATAGDPRWW
jgi:hypothetical protein